MPRRDSFPYLLIDDAEASRIVAAPQPLAESSAWPGYMGWQHPDAPHLFADVMPTEDPIPRSQWLGLIKAGQGNFLSDVLKQQNIKAKMQGRLNYCWGYGSVRAVEAQRAVMGLPYIDLSPESVCGPCTGWRNKGGYASQAFAQLEQAGACESSYMDAPHSLSPNRWKPGWEADAKRHEVVHWQKISANYDAVISELLRRRPVAAGLPWWGHLVCFLDPVILPDGSVGVLFQNSWDVDWPTKGANGYATLTEAKATPDGAAVPVIVTPDEE